MQSFDSPELIAWGFLRFKHDLSESASHQIPDRQYPHLIRCGYGAMRFAKKKTRSMAGFVKMGDKRLRQQPPVILLMIGLTNKDRGPYRLIRRHDHRSDLFSRQLHRFLIIEQILTTVR